jgi:hypothetical protein
MKINIIFILKFKNNLEFQFINVEGKLKLKKNDVMMMSMKNLVIITRWYKLYNLKEKTK